MRKKKAARLILFAALFLASCQAVPSAASQALPAAPSSQTETREPLKQAAKGIIRNPDFDEALTPEVQQIVLEFMEQWFTAQANLAEPEFSGLFDESTVQGREALAFNEMVLSCIMESRRSRPSDLTITDYDYGITFWRAKENEDGSLRLAFMEDSRVRFAFLPDTVSSHVGYHSMTLNRVDGAYKIISHLDRQDAGLTVHKEYEQRKKDGNLTPERLTDADVDRLLSAMQTEIRGEAGAETTVSSKPHPAAPGNRYDRDAAVRYAEQWVGDIRELRNEEWQNFEMYGGDCNNFVAQCLFAAGIPMDIQGNAQWKWYGDAINPRNTAAGRTPSWSGVGPFYDYCAMNDGFGLSAQVDADFKDAEPGDVIQFGVLGKWMHSVIITDVIRDADGVLVDFLVAAHSADRKNYPASAYYFPTARLIKVLGWNPQS